MNSATHGAGRLHTFVVLMELFHAALGEYPTMELLSEWSGVSRSTLYRAQRELREMLGEPRRGPGGRRVVRGWSL